jgi:hypothetical protein
MENDKMGKPNLGLLVGYERLVTVVLIIGKFKQLQTNLSSYQYDVIPMT